MDHAQKSHTHEKPVHKTVALVLALTKPHNFYAVMWPIVLRLTSGKTSQLELFHWLKQHTGASRTTNTVTPLESFDGGNHFDDIGFYSRYNRQRRYMYLCRSTGKPLPRDRLHSHILDIGLARPMPIPPRC